MSHSLLIPSGWEQCSRTQPDCANLSRTYDKKPPGSTMWGVHGSQGASLPPSWGGTRESYV